MLMPKDGGRDLLFELIFTAVENGLMLICQTSSRDWTGFTWGQLFRPFGDRRVVMLDADGDAINLEE
jgi:hypothetical protein